ncbi:MAG: transglycosylase domain-containing protein [Zoogloeaceae bacterium]|jgi:penicillin-binding protein 1A|nr:transglycosylase domain-containing protein [Zoogloeaceae bacterium]
MMRWLRWLLALLAITFAAPILMLISIWCGLPSLDGLVDEHPEVKIETVPAVLKQAILAAEDAHFYEHHGIASSTITLQLVRQRFTFEDRQPQRGLSELLLALKIELNFSKDQILELYINKTFLGQRAYGFAAASQTYFGKPLDRISLAEAAILAGLPKAPSIFNPVVNPKRARQRQEYVLQRMLRAGMINDEQFRQALEEPVHTRE